MGNFILMPKLGMTMTDGKIIKWLKNIGDDVEKGDYVFEVETDKTSLEVDALYDGKLLKIFFDEGETAPINYPVGYIGAEGEEIPPLPEMENAPAAETETKAAPAAAAPKAAPKKEAKPKKKIDMSKFDYELLVIGAGPGGYVAAIRAAQLGAKVAIVECDEVGGTCLNRGCIPTKALYTSAKVFGKLKHCADYGLSVSGAGFDWKKIMERKDGIVKQLTTGVAGLLKKNGVTIIKGRAKITDANTVEVDLNGTKTKHSAGYIMIATGTQPISVLKNVDKAVKINTTDDILAMQTLPKSMVIVGGGVIGVEIANIMSSFDVDVTILELMPTIIPMVDAEISTMLKSKLVAKGVKILNEVTANTIKKDGKDNVLELSNGETIKCEYILEAVGRGVVSDAFADMKLSTSPRGFITVDESMCSSVDSIYAIGDVTGGYMLAHEASEQGIIAVETMFGEAPTGEMLIPSCIFTEPEISFVGKTEQQAKDAGIPAKSFKFPFAANGKALTLGESDGFVKVVVDERYGEILGVHIIGPEASSLIHEAVMAMNLEATAQSAGHVVHAHPTLSEALMEAFLGASTGAIHM
ncbi:MAG: dihydrolipoyl dehydrogenase [Christensenellaceae bacterium]